MTFEMKIGKHLFKKNKGIMIGISGRRICEKNWRNSKKKYLKKSRI